MDWFLYDGGLRHVRFKMCSVVLLLLMQLRTLVIRAYTIMRNVGFTCDLGQES